ncbi:MAG: hypothetical protein HYT07_02540 [Candidatus Levybacteria bacterium]|nr:hypothetical protein [Candidatus Levybacteria bacterium]
MFLSQKFFFPFILSILILFTYWDLPKTFFQQDEWWTFGQYVQNEQAYGGIEELIKSSKLIGKGHFTPLFNIIFFLQYKIFGMNFSLYALVSIFTHILNIFLAYIFANSILKNKYLAILASIFFATNSISHQAISWVSASLNTQGSTLFSTLSYLTFFLYLKKENSRMLFISFLSLIAALLFKEILAPFFILPIMIFLYAKKDIKITLVKVLKPFSLIFFSYVLFRIVIFFLASPSVVNAVQAQHTGIYEFAFRIIILPFRAIAQSLIPSEILLFLSENLIRLSYPQFIYSDNAVDPFIRETIAYDLVCFFISVIILFLSYVSCIFFKKKNEIFLRGIILFLSVIIFSLIVIILISGRAGFVSLIEPRHFYVGSLGSSTFLILVLFGLFSLLFKQKAKFILTAILIPILLINIAIIKNDISGLESIGSIRKKILMDIKEDYPRIPKNIVLYTQSDTAYYGMPDDEKILPVQVGFGWMILSWYNEKGSFPPCMYDQKLFLHLLSQGYKECSGRSFGYFRNYEKLMESVEKYNIPYENIIAYLWKNDVKKLTNASVLIRHKLKKDLEIKL